MFRQDHLRETIRLSFLRFFEFGSLLASIAYFVIMMEEAFVAAERALVAVALFTRELDGITEIWKVFSEDKLCFPFNVYSTTD